MTSPRRLRRPAFRCADDRGTVMIIFASIVLVCIGLTALVTDVGASRDARARLLTSTDAAALAAVQDYAKGDNGCNADENDDGVVGADEKSTAEKRLHANSSGAVLDFCGLSTGPSGAQVLTVSAHEDTSYLLGPVFGDDSGVSYASSSVRFGNAAAATGLRPIGICYDSPFLADWAALGYPNPSPVYHFVFSENIGLCGHPAGNWGLMDFDAGENAASKTRDWMTNGYDGTISVDDLVDGDPGAPAPGLGVDLLIGTIGDFPIVKFQGGNGNNTVYEIIGYVRVEVTAAEEGGTANNRWMDVRFWRGTVDGPCCVQNVDPNSPENAYYGLVASEVCGTDNDLSDC